MEILIGVNVVLAIVGTMMVVVFKIQRTRSIQRRNEILQSAHGALKQYAAPIAQSDRA